MRSRAPLTITDAVFRVIDTETTGLDPATDRICEFAAIDVINVDGKWRAGVVQSTLTDPSMPIPPAAKAVHHITERMVFGKPAPEIVVREWLGNLTLHPSVFVAHHAPFDRAMLEAIGFPPGCRWLDTRRLAMHLWEEAPSFGNEVLRYWLGRDVVPWEGATHRAEHDVQVTAMILCELFGHLTRTYDVDELIEYSESAVVLKGPMGFGKHHDKTWAECADADPGYLDWMIKQEDREPGAWEPDKIHTARHYRGRLV